jgi:hypothetical protein
MARLLVGLVVTLCASGAALTWKGAFASPGGRGPARWLVADRDGARVVSVDERLYRVASAPADFPVRVATHRGGAWIACAVGGNPLGPHELVALDRAGRPVGPRTALDPVLDLAVDTRDGAAFVVTLGAPGGRRELRAIPTPGSARHLGTLRDASCLAARGGRLLVGGEDGRLHLLERAGDAVHVLRRRSVPGQVGDVAPGPAGGWWVLDVVRGRVVFLDHDLSTRWDAAAGLTALHLAPVRDQQRVWLVDTTQPLARRLGPGGVSEVLVQGLPLGGLDRAVARDDGGLVLVAPGALLELDGTGRLVRTQGGFDFLVDVARYR